MNRDLLEALVAASAKLQEAAKVAREHGRADIVDHLRSAGWGIAKAISDVAVDRAAEVTS